MNASLRERAEHAAKYGANLVVAATEIKQLLDERNEAIAHDRQPYPTADAYETACAARDKHHARADEAEARINSVRVLHMTDADGNCAHCTRGRVYPVPAPCATAAAFAESGDAR